jgi:hypothetical protein
MDIEVLTQREALRIKPAGAQDASGSVEAAMLHHYSTLPLNGLFVSPRHTTASLYRTDPCLRSVHKILLATGVFLAVMGAMFGYQLWRGHQLDQEKERLAIASNGLSAQEAEFAPLIASIQEAQSWRPVIEGRKPGSIVLGALESSLPPNVCLTSFTLRNTLSDPKAPDQPEIRISGWYKEGGLSEFMEVLASKLPGYSTENLPRRDGVMKVADAIPFQIKLNPKTETNPETNPSPL